MYSKLLASILITSSSMSAFAGIKAEPINKNSKEEAQYIFLIAEHHEHKDSHDHEGHDHHEMESDDNTKKDENQKPVEDEFKAKPYGQ
ncbi:MAG: hypothetical protein RIQ57_1190 [Pseudomonadota bacterium]